MPQNRGVAAHALQACRCSAIASICSTISPCRLAIASKGRVSIGRSSWRTRTPTFARDVSSNFLPDGWLASSLASVAALDLETLVRLGQGQSHTDLEDPNGRQEAIGWNPGHLTQSGGGPFQAQPAVRRHGQGVPQVVIGRPQVVVGYSRMFIDDCRGCVGPLRRCLCGHKHRLVAEAPALPSKIAEIRLIRPCLRIRCR